MAESKEVATRDDMEVGAPMPDGAWGAADEVTPDDFLISKALLMQPLSEFVVNGLPEGENAEVGEYRDSISGDLLGKTGEFFEVLIFHRDMTWVIFEGDPLKYKETVRLTDENRDWPIVEGDIQRNKTFNFYCLNAKTATQPDVVPIVISLKRTGLRTAKKLQMHFGKLKSKNLPSVEKVIQFKSIKRTNDRGQTFFVADYEVGRDATKEEKTAAWRWYENVKMALAEGRARVDDSDEVAKNKKKPEGGEEDDGDVPF